MTKANSLKHTTQGSCPVGAGLSEQKIFTTDTTYYRPSVTNLSSINIHLMRKY